MAKWNKKTFINKTKHECLSHVSMITMDLIKFAEDNADQIVWGNGDQYGTMTFKCKSIGLDPIEHPPGKDTLAVPYFAKSGPKTKTPARIVFKKP